MNREEERSLFRHESIEAKTGSWAGTSSLPKNISLRMTAWISVAVLGALIAFLSFAQYTRRVPALGVLMPAEGIIRVSAPATGWIKEAFVDDGDQVKADTPLYRLSIDNITDQGNTQEVIASLLRQRKDEVTAQIDRRRSISENEKFQLQDELQRTLEQLRQIEDHQALLADFTADLKENSDVQRSSMERGLTTRSALEAREQAYMAYRVELETLKRDQLQMEARASQIELQLAGFEENTASVIGDLAQQVIEIDSQLSESEARREIRVVASRAGRVTAVMAREGQTVNVGAPMLTITPFSTELQVHLLVPSSAAGFIEVGDRVLMRYESFPYQRYGQFPGTIATISRTTLRPEEIDQILMGGSSRGIVGAFYRITVRPDATEIRKNDGVLEALQTGMQVEAHILAESRPLFQWLLSPLYGISGSLTIGREEH